MSAELIAPKEIMTVAIGSTNHIKVLAVEEVFMRYPIFNKVKFVSGEVPSGVSNQPLSLEETIRGARNRAKAAYNSCDLSLGIESGLFAVPYTETGYMNICACVIFDGTNYFTGLASAFECPLKTVELMVHKGLDMNEAFNKLGITKNPKLGLAEGSVGILTNGRVNRLEYTKQAIIMALIRIENAHLFK